MFAQTIFAFGVVTTPNIKIVWANILKLVRNLKRKLETNKNPMNQDNFIISLKFLVNLSVGTKTAH